jgi:E3 ubiquitin-protein ligase RGLG
MRALVIGLCAAMCVYSLGLMPIVLAFGLGLSAATTAGFIGAGLNVDTFIENLRITELIQRALPAGTELPRALTMTSRRPKNVQEVQRNLRGAGLENCSLIVGIDFTRSNLTQGFTTYHERSLHSLEFAKEGKLNPYQSVLNVIGDTLAVFDDDGLIPAYYFGDKTTRDHSVKPLAGKPAAGFAQLLEQYAAVVDKVHMDGPTSFGPLITKACELVRDSDNEFHILVIITDGAVNDRNDETRKAIIEAAATCPLAIVAIGVGDGPWDEMQKFDDELPERRFDNFTFVNYEEIKRKYDGSDVVFAEEALRETPKQYRFLRANGYMGAKPGARRR